MLYKATMNKLNDIELLDAAKLKYGADNQTAITLGCSRQNLQNIRRGIPMSENIREKLEALLLE